MDPKKAQRLKKTAAIKEFIPILLREAKKLDTVTDIKTKVPAEIAVEVEARKLAYNKIVDILKPLIDSREVDKFNLKEYVA